MPKKLASRWMGYVRKKKFTFIIHLETIYHCDKDTLTH